ncbi:nectin-1-like [Pelodytes ibericus]
MQFFDNISSFFSSVSLSVTMHVNEHVYAMLGMDAELHCWVETEEHLTQVTWERRVGSQIETILTHKNEKTLFAKKETITFVGNWGVSGNILIRNVTLVDEGTYICSFTTFPSATREKEILLVVQVYPEVFAGTPVDPVTSGNVFEKLALCIARGAKPPVNITWLTGGLVYESEDTTELHENRTVTTTSLLRMVPHRELYGRNVTCKGTQMNIEVEHLSTFTLQNIQFAPASVHIQVIPSEAQALQLSCESDSNPPASKFTWRRENGSADQTLEGSNKQMTLNGNIPSGLYVCEAENSVGSMSGNLYIYGTNGMLRRLFPITHDAMRSCTSYWYITLLFLIPSLLANAVQYYYLYQNKRIYARRDIVVY